MENNKWESRQFLEMERAAREWLQDKDPAEIAANCGGEYDSEQNVLRLGFIGNTLTISLPDYRPDRELGIWEHLMLLHYLNLGDGTPMTGRLINFGSLKDGMVRGGGFDRNAERTLSRQLSSMTEEEIIERFTAAGAVPAEGRGDLTFVFYFFPHYPVTVNVWLADEDFPVSAKMMVDASADHYLMIEDAVTVGDVLIEQLTNRI